jgi:hypothetical protein
MLSRGRSGKWLVAEAVEVGLVIVLVLGAAVVAESKSTGVHPVGVVYLVVAVPLALLTVLGMVARPATAAVELGVGALFMMSGFRGSSWPKPCGRCAPPARRGPFAADAVERDFEAPASAPMTARPAPRTMTPRRGLRTARSPAADTPFRAAAAVEVVTLAGGVGSVTERRRSRHGRCPGRRAPTGWC